MVSSLCMLNKLLNSLATGKLEWNFRNLILQMTSVIDGWGISCELALRWMSLDLTDDKSTLVQVMAWCRQATSHYLSQCWPRSPSPYGVTRLQWVKFHWVISELSGERIIERRELNSAENCPPSNIILWWNNETLPLVIRVLLVTIHYRSKSSSCEKFPAIWRSFYISSHHLWW